MDQRYGSLGAQAGFAPVGFKKADECDCQGFVVFSLLLLHIGALAGAAHVIYTKPLQ